MTPTGLYRAALLVVTLRSYCYSPGGELDVRLDGGSVCFVNTESSAPDSSVDGRPYLNFLKDVAGRLACRYEFVQTCQKSLDGTARRRCYALDGDETAGYYDYGAREWIARSAGFDVNLPKDLCFFACERYDAVATEAPTARISLSASWGTLRCVVEGFNLADGKMYWLLDGRRVSVDDGPVLDETGRWRLSSTLYADSASRYSCTFVVSALVWQEAAEYRGFSYRDTMLLLGASTALCLTLFLTALDDARRFLGRRLRYAPLEDV